MKIGAAWVRETKKGDKYLSCVIQIPLFGNVNFAMFKNTDKSEEKQPDYNIAWSDSKQEKDEENKDVVPF